ncbi:MAG: DUF1295 domain-containing protein [Gammaproteobacteria bacterium]|nr:MAG: DUF1295 domain-containing protein [Gammaproteobacteria bacterium]
MGRRIQFIFSGFALAMLGLLAWRVASGAWSPLHWAMLAVAGACSLLVFQRFVHVFNYSYALASLLNGLLIAIWLQTPAAWLLGGLATAYGLRLALFTWHRQASPSYAPRVAKVGEADRQLPLPARLSLWLMCSLLYGFHLQSLAMAGSQVAFAGARPLWSPAVVAGAGLMLAGLLIEAIADWQKQRVKADDPQRLVTAGLYRRWRHPNYAGEILYQFGLISAGLAGAMSIDDALTAVIAPAYIVLLMLSEAWRLDRVQSLRHGASEAYRRWRRQSASLWPRLW